jgi:hypothetical protein
MTLCGDNGAVSRTQRPTGDRTEIEREDGGVIFLLRELPDAWWNIGIRRGDELVDGHHECLPEA